MQDKSQRTEQPTPRRIEKARREGQFLSSRDLVSAVQFLCFVAMLAAWGGAWFTRTGSATRAVLRQAFAPDLEKGAIAGLTRDILWNGCAPLAAAGGALALGSLACQLATTKMGFSLKRLAPDFRRLNPVSRVRDLFRQNVWAVAKALVMLPAFCAAVYFVVRGDLETYLALPLMELHTGVRRISEAILQLLWKAAGAFLVFGAADLFRQRRQYQQDLRMTKQEVREEAKELEGNPQVKARVRRLQRELLRHQMMKEVKTATAVVVNPTHYAVAIRYRLESMTAPVVVAKGKNHVARRIRRLALEHQVPLIENPPLAQALYKSAEVGQEIPAHLYRAVAEVLAYVYRLMNGKLPG